MLGRVHTPEYLQKLTDGLLSEKEIRVLGLRWSASLWRRSRLASQGTYLAALAALSDGLAANLAGGTHHAFADHGEGFCVLNDVAISIASLRAQKLASRFLIVDLDVHQGNGTAAIFQNDSSVFTLSLHGARNYPAQKASSSLDVPLNDGTTDIEYLQALAQVLPGALAAARPDLVFYLAGVDVVAGDRYGRLAMTSQGLLARERYVLKTVRDQDVPLVITLAGGYAATPLATAQLHSHVFEAAIEVECGAVNKV